MSKTIIIKSQSDWNAISSQTFTRDTTLRVECDVRMILSGTSSPHVVAWGSSQPHVVAWGSSQPHVVARESSQPHVEARESSQPHVEARESSQPHVVARESSQPHVEAWGSSQPHVEARESSQPHVEAWGSSQPHVEAWGSSQLQVSGYAAVKVEAYGFTAVNLHNGSAAALLFGCAIAFLHAKSAKVVKKSKTAQVIKIPPRKWTPSEWLDKEAVPVEKDRAILYKRVSKDFKTQEGTPNETTWTPGVKLEHPAWNPKEEECGAGKFHACGRPYFCDEFRDTVGDRYVAIQIAVKDLFAWKEPSYPHKIAFRAGTVLGECNRFGKLLEAAK